MRTLSLGLGALLLTLGCGSTHAGTDAGPLPDGFVPQQDSGTLCQPPPANHRASATACSPDRTMEPITGMNGDCFAHTDCTDGDNGRCVGDPRGGFLSCTYDRCASDSDCGSGPCECGGGDPRVGANSCLGGNCQVDSDCGANGFCSPTLGSCGNFGGTVGYYCHTCEDECVDDADCQGADLNAYCAFDQAVGHWACASAQCAG